MGAEMAPERKDWTVLVQDHVTGLTTIIDKNG